MKTPEERGQSGRWLVGARMARGYPTKEKALAALAAAGVAISSSVYAEYEAGTKPVSKRHMPMLLKFWGPMPEESPIADSATLIRALTRQAEAMEALVRELRLGRERDQDAASAMMRAAEVLVSGQRPQGDGESTGQPAPRGNGQ